MGKALAGRQIVVFPGEASANPRPGGCEAGGNCIVHEGGTLFAP